jgi:putative signal transducing protein
MDEIQWAQATEVYGRMQAEMLKSFLEAEGVPVELFQEGAGMSAFPTSVGALALVEVFVPKDKLAEAQELIAAFQRPENEVIDDESALESPGDEEPEG